MRTIRCLLSTLHDRRLEEMPGPGLRAVVSVGRGLGRLAWERGHPSEAMAVEQRTKDYSHCPSSTGRQ